MLQCENNCACKPVCKEIDNWKKYCEDHIRLRERSVLFDSEPNCPYYINKGCVTNSIVDMGKGVIHSKDGSKTIIGDSPYDPEKQKDAKTWVNKSDRKDEPYKITFHNGLPVTELKSKVEDKTMATKEDKEEYEFIKELEKSLGFLIRMDGIRGL